MLAPPMLHSPWSRITAALGLAGLIAAGCARAPQRSSAPSAEPTAQDAAGGDALAAETSEESTPRDESASDYEQRLLAHEDALLQAGVSLPAAVRAARAEGGLGTEATPAADAAPDRCTRICDISAAICELREHVCGLSEEHADEPRYVEVCDRATLDCERATTACSDCDA